jgi:hypothetical protein
LDLQTQLETVKPKPNEILWRRTKYNVTGWTDDGLAVYYSYDYLDKEGKLSADVDQPFKRILDEIVVVAREFKQVGRIH